MEAASDQSAAPEMHSRSKLRYPLRSSTKPRDDKSAVVDAPSSKRGRLSSTVSKSVSVFNLSGKEKSSKPPRRLSVPSKYAASQQVASSGSITPISENRMKKSKIQVKSETPISDISKSIARRKFSVLSSVSYWLSQIKLSESASKHSISLGFFKLALESGCEPLQRVSEELKSYALRHNLVAQLGEPAKELLQSYNILEDLEKLQVSESSSQEPEHRAESSMGDSNNSPTAARSGSLKPRSLNSETLKVAEAHKKESAQKNLPAATAKVRASYNKNPANVGAAKDANANTQKLNKANKSGSNKGAEKVRRSTRKSTVEKMPVDSIEIPAAIAQATPEEENKENLANPLQEISSNEEVQAS